MVTPCRACGSADDLAFAGMALTSSSDGRPVYACPEHLDTVRARLDDELDAAEWSVSAAAARE